MLDLNAHAHFARAWSEMTTSCMTAAFAQSVSNMGAMVDVWATATGLPSGQIHHRNPLSTAMPWYRAPEPTPFGPMPWLALFSAPSPFMAMQFQPPQLPLNAWWPSQSASWLMPSGSQAHGVSAVVPPLLALVAMGAMAQHALALIDLSREWQRMPLHNQSRPHPTFRSDGGHATAAIVTPAVDAIAALPAAGFAFTLRMIQAMSAR